jgi:hypothetical protein
MKFSIKGWIALVVFVFGWVAILGSSSTIRELRSELDETRMELAQSQAVQMPQSIPVSTPSGMAIVHLNNCTMVMTEEDVTVCEVDSSEIAGDAIYASDFDPNAFASGVITADVIAADAVTAKIVDAIWNTPLPGTTGIVIDDDSKDTWGNPTYWLLSGGSELIEVEAYDGEPLIIEISDDLGKARVIRATEETK